jgi:hypothetical protein
MIFTRGALCSRKAKHELPRCIYDFFHDPRILIEKEPKICKLFLTVKLSLSVMLTVKNNLKTSGFFPKFVK